MKRRIYYYIIGGFLMITTLVYGVTQNEKNPDKDKFLMEIISYVLDRGHIDPKTLDDRFSENVFKDFIEAIDGQHRFFLQADIRSFERYKFEIDDQFKQTSLEFFDKVYTVLMQRMNQVERFYENLLGQPFDFSVSESINLDYENLPYVKSNAQLEERWRKRFKLDILERFTTLKEEEAQKKEQDTSYIMLPDMVLELKARETTLENMEVFFENYNELERKDWFEVYINAIVSQFDPHTLYFAPNDKDRFDMNISGKFEGIGARLEKRNGEVKIVEVISGGPVWRDELLEVGDIILEVAQENEMSVAISGMRLEDAIKLIKGPKGTTVFLKIKRVDGNIEEVPVVRDVVELEETFARSSLIELQNKKYGLIELPKFYVSFNDYGERNAASDVKKELEQLKAKGVSGIILDLRNNGGGSLKTVVDMTGFFIDQGPVVQVKSTGGRKEVLKDTDRSIVWDGPLVVLVNEFSASASEILAGALQDYKRAIILGSKQTYGKGTVQNMVDLNSIISNSTYGDLGAIKITTDKFYRINGRSTQLEGVQSDVVFPDRYAYIELGEKDQNNPLPWDRITPAVYTPWKMQNNYEVAIANSQSRLKNNPLIQLIDQQAKWVKEQQEKAEFPLSYKAFKRERLDNKSYSEQFEELNLFESDYTFQWLPDANETIEISEDFKEKRERWQKSLKKDLYIYEAVNILSDLNNTLVQSKPLTTAATLD